MSAEARLLIVDDDPAIVAGLVAAFTGPSNDTRYEITSTTNAADAVALYQAHDPHVVILDVGMEPLDGFGVLAALRRADPDACVIMLTGHDDVRAAVRAMREGAENYLTKPYEAESLRLTVAKALAHVQLSRQHRLSAAQLPVDPGTVEAMLTAPVVRLLEIMARKRSPLLVVGEAGTAKQLAATLSHRLSHGTSEPLLQVQASRTPADGLEALLFGETEHAAAKDRGLVHLARRGTLFVHLAEALPISVQARLARVYGSSDARDNNTAQDAPARSRLVVSSRATLGEFKQRMQREFVHLFAPLPLHIPALRARGRDGIVALAHVLLRDQFARTGTGPSQLSEGAQDLLGAHTWPGNIPELEDCLSMAALQADTRDTLSADDIRAVLQDPGLLVVTPEVRQETPVLRTLAQVEQEHVAAVIRACQGNVSEAARVLGITRTTLYKRMRDIAP
ncbi:MAG: sigma-54-dependent Fis family transcriptional regulator [Gemmatimonadaceae bacterium]|nr:sigma-54-dependent Fis family transcriptional regulator [Gemmatimonadaceae bacterium]